MSNYKFNISGCFKLKDYKEAAKWFSKAVNNLNSAEYEALVLNLFKEHPSIFSIPELAPFRANIKSTSELKKSIEIALKAGNINHALNLFNNHFSYKENPELFESINTYKKTQPAISLQSSIKKDLNNSEKELERDLITYLNDLDKPFYHRVQTELGNFYFTKGYYYDLSTIKEKQVRFARHLPWNHELSRHVLETEIGQSGKYGMVSLIGRYKPDEPENDLKDVRYQTLSGRSYFASAFEALTDQKVSISSKIDIESFMKMKEVIPTPSQMKAISADGNYIIDGPAGTGKSTTLLQKLLILRTEKNVNTNKILILVKHDGLIKPFEDLLSSMKIHGVNINSTSQFLKIKLADDYDQITLEDLDEADSQYKELNTSLNYIFNQSNPSDKDIENLPGSIVNTSLIFNDFKTYCQLVHDRENLANDIKNKESELIGIVEEDYKIDARLEEYILSISTLDKKVAYCNRLKMDPSDQKEINKLNKEYKKTKKMLDDTDAEGKLRYEKYINDISAKFEVLIENTKGTNNFNQQVTLKEHINLQINNKVKEKRALYEKDLLNKIIEKLDENSDFKGLKHQQEILNKSLESNIQKIRDLAWGVALTARSSKLRKAIQLHHETKSSKDKFHTVIIDEAQDVPIVHVELINFYTQNLIIAGDEAQRENSDGVGQWKNLRKNINIHSNGQPTTYKLRHNFRQTYELGNLSYNYRQLLLGNHIEDLESDYFDNQKGFNIPVITGINYLSLVIKNKLKYIENTFEQNFPIVLVVGSSSEQVKIAKKLEREGFSISTSEENNNADIIIKTTQDIAGREYPVLISMLSKDMTENTVYIILSRAKFDLTLITQDDYELDTYFNTLMMSKMLSYDS